MQTAFLDNCLTQSQDQMLTFSEYRDPPNYGLFSAPALRLDSNMNEQVGKAFNNCRKFMHVGYFCTLNLFFAIFTIFSGLEPVIQDIQSLYPVYYPSTYNSTNNQTTASNSS